MKAIYQVLLFLLLLAIAPVAHAAIVGTDVGVTVAGSTSFAALNISQPGQPRTTSTTITVGPGFDFTLLTEPTFFVVPAEHAVDLSDDSIYFVAEDSNGYGNSASVSFSGLDWGGPAHCSQQKSYSAQTGVARRQRSMDSPLATPR